VGYPGGGPERESPARIAEQIRARGTNIYRTGETRRDVLVLAAALVPGDSGGALFNDRGKVVGLAFAVDPSDANTSYALARSEVDNGLDPVIRSGASAPVDTGPCLVG
jgi:S1-C subfamily serine protease